MELIHSTKNKEIRIFSHPEYGRIAICRDIIGFNLCEKFAAKYNAIIPTLAMAIDLNNNCKNYYPLNTYVKVRPFNVKLSGSINPQHNGKNEINTSDKE